MLYSIVGIDNANSLQARIAVRSEHVERLNALRDAGRLIIAGIGSLLLEAAFVVDR